MKKLMKCLLFALPLLFLFSGCPVGVDYPLGFPGKEPIDKALLGAWVTAGEDPDFGKVIIEKKDNYSYKITVSELGSMYSLDVTEFTGWATKIKDKTFIYAQPVGSSDTDYYLYCYQAVNKNTMTSSDVGLLVGGVDAVTSTESYRQEVEASMDKEEFLSMETVWTRK